MTTSLSMRNTEADLPPLVRVAVGVIRNDAGQILIALRGKHQHQGGLWEFPGGKIEAGETCRDALSRELKEELGIDTLHVEPLIQIEHHYADKSVLLEVSIVTEFRGNAVGHEGQPLKWVSPKDLYRYDFPAANKPILNAISLPRCMAITGNAATEREFLRGLHTANGRGAQMLLLRLKGHSFDHWRRCHDLAQSSIQDLPVIFNSAVGEHYWAKLPGLHLTSEHLLMQASRPIARPALLGASCHNESQIRHANAIDVDYITLSPVLHTSSHPHAEPLGWDRFEALVRLAHCPVYALGGLADADLAAIRDLGGHGVAAMSHYWD